MTTKATKKKKLTTKEVKPTAVKFTLTSGIINQMIKRVLPCASREETRYYLNGICFEYIAKEKHLYLVATDGHRLSRMILKDIETDAKADFRFIAGFDALALMDGAYKHLKISCSKLALDSWPVDFELAADGKTFSMKCNEQSAVMKTIDGTFPDYRRVYPKNPKKVVGFNGKYMAEICKAATGGCDKAAIGIEFHFVPEEGDRRHQPFMIKGNDGDKGFGHEIILMPMRTGDDKGKYEPAKPKPLFYIHSKGKPARAVHMAERPVTVVRGEVIKASEK